MDQINGYICNCASGFQGLTCGESKFFSYRFLGLVQRTVSDDCLFDGLFSLTSKKARLCV